MDTMIIKSKDEFESASEYVRYRNQFTKELLFSFPSYIKESIFKILEHSHFADNFSKETFNKFDIAEIDNFATTCAKRFGSIIYLEMVEFWVQSIIKAAINNELNNEDDVYNIMKIESESIMNTNDIGSFSIIISNTFIANYILEHIDDIIIANITFVTSRETPDQITFVIDISDDIGIRFTVKDNFYFEETDFFEGREFKLYRQGYIYSIKEVVE